MRRNIIAIASLAIMAVGAGPCDVLQDPDEKQAADAGDCGVEECSDLLEVEVIRADNQQFMGGVYAFEVLFPDQSMLSIQCLLNYAEQGLICDSGDLTEMIAAIDPTGLAFTISMIEAPQIADVSVRYNDLLIGERVLTPSYEEIEPNGPDCPPLCFVGEAAMAVKSW